jgi:ferredoxin-NADP reductase
MVAASRAALAAVGVPEGNIRFESFTPARPRSA